MGLTPDVDLACRILAASGEFILDDISHMDGSRRKLQEILGNLVKSNLLSVVNGKVYHTVKDTRLITLQEVYLAVGDYSFTSGTALTPVSIYMSTFHNGEDDESS